MPKKSVRLAVSGLLCGLGVIVACSGGGGSGGAPLSVACDQKAGADGDKDCSGRSDGKTRKLDCSSSETESAIAAGCSRINEGGSDVCCPLTVAGKTTGPSGSAPVQCRQKSDSDTESDCASQAGKPRKLDCDSAAQTNAAVAAGCTPTKPGDSDVCCPLTVTGVADTGGGTSSSGSSGQPPPDAGGPNGSCSNYAGSWNLSGTCGTTSCTVSQTGCSASISCTSGTSLSGTVSGNTATLTGSSSSLSLSCTATFSSASSFGLQCNVCSGVGTKAGP